MATKSYKSGIKFNAGKKMPTPKHPKGGKMPKTKPNLKKPAKQKVGNANISGIGDDSA